MSKRATRGREGSEQKKKEAKAEVVAMKPRRGLFIALLIALLLWVGFLIVLYVTTVRH